MQDLLKKTSINSFERFHENSKKDSRYPCFDNRNRIPRVFYHLILNAFFGLFKSSSYEELAENYNEKSREIVHLQKHINTIVGKDKVVKIEFDNEERLGIFHVSEGENHDRNWDVKIGSGKSDTLLLKLGWTNQTLAILKEKLDEANCISIASGNPCQIGYQRSGMGMYFYNLFDKPLNDSLKMVYNDSCQYVFHNKRVVFEYGGGSLGPQCFPDFR